MSVLLIFDLKNELLYFLKLWYYNIKFLVLKNQSFRIYLFVLGILIYQDVLNYYYIIIIMENFIYVF